MKFIQHYSGSRGNLYEVVAKNGKRLMVECGVNWKDIQRAFRYDFGNVVACLITHEHKDHSRAVNDVIRAGIPVYCSKGTARALNIRGSACTRERYYSPPESGLAISTFEAVHDCAEPVTFTIAEKETGETLFFATDTAFILQRFRRPLAIIAIECSYDTDLLKSRIDSGDADKTHGLRLLESHQSKAAAMDYLDRHCDLSKCKEIHLLHLSRENIADPEALRKEFEERYFIPTFVKD